MKASLLTLLILIFTMSVNAQDTDFKLLEEGLTDYIVVQVDSLKSSNQYSKCIEWIGKTYRDPSEVIKSKVENTSVRIEGVVEGLIKAGGVSFDTRYQVEISFRDGRFKFDVLNLETYSVQMGWTQFPVGEWREYFKNGQLKRSWINLGDIPLYFNNLSSSLKKYILEVSSPENEKW